LIDEFNFPLKMNSFRIACLGGGYDSAIGRVHHSAMGLDGCFAVVAGCFSTDPDQNRVSAEMFGVSPDRVYHDLEDMIKHELGRIDAVVVLTPTDQHSDQVAKLLKAGVPVICEKALAGNSADIQSLKSLCSSTNGFLSVTYNYLGFPMVREIKMMIESGRLGRLCHINLQMPQEGFIRLNQATNLKFTPQPWRLVDHFVPTISLDLGVHLHSLVSYLTGLKPKDVVAVSAKQGNFSLITDYVSAIANYTDDVICNFCYGKTSLGQRNGLKLQIFGQLGSVEWVQEDSERLRVSDQYGNVSIVDRGTQSLMIANAKRYERFKPGHPSGFIEAFANYYFDTYFQLLAYREGRKIPKNGCDIDVALEGLLFLEAVERSCRSKSWVTM